MRKEAVQQERDRISGTIRRTNSILNLKTIEVPQTPSNDSINSPLKYLIFI